MKDSKFALPGLALILTLTAFSLWWIFTHPKESSVAAGSKKPVANPTATAIQSVVSEAPADGPPPRAKRPSLPQTPGVNGAIGSLTASGVDPLHSKVETVLSPGQSMVMGGYPTADGRHEFSVITPHWVGTKNGGSQVHFDIKILKLDALGLIDSGLESLVTSERRAEQNAEVWSPEDVAETLENSVGVELTSAPSVYTMPGAPARIQCGADGARDFYSMMIEATEGPNGGFHLKSEITRIK